MSVKAQEDKAKAEAAIQGGGDCKFTKMQILKSSRYAERRYLLGALLKDGAAYSHSDIERIINEHSNRKAV